MAAYFWGFYLTVGFSGVFTSQWSSSVEDEWIRNNTDSFYGKVETAGENIFK